LRSKSKGKSEGVSEVVGYLLVFLIVVTVVSVIYTSGMPLVEQTQESSAIMSMETAFLALQGHIKKVAVGQSPVRTMKLSLVKGTMSAQDNAGTITIDRDGSPVTISFGNIEYTLGAQKIIYENGAVITHSPGGNIIVSEPLILFTNYSGNNADVFISVINTSGSLSTSGELAEIQMGPYNVTRDTRVYYSAAPANFVNISINSPYAHAWSLFLSNSYKETFGEDPCPTCSGWANNFCWLKITKGQYGVAENLNLTLITHNVTVS
jgi:hypothetical protein